MTTRDTINPRQQIIANEFLEFRLLISGNYGAITSSLQKYVDTFLQDENYEIEPIFNKKIVKDTNNIPVLTYEIGTEYNFYTDLYEDTVKTAAPVLEPSLPNLYIIGDDRNNESEKYLNIITAEGLININPNSSNNSFEYYDEYCNLYKWNASDARQKSAKINNIVNSQKSQLFTKECLENLNPINGNQYLLPYGNKFSFKTHQNSSLMDIAESGEFSDYFCSAVIKMTQDFRELELNILTDTVLTEQGSLELARSVNSETVLAYGFKSDEEMVYRLLAELKNVEDGEVFFLGKTTKQNTTQTSNSTTTAIANNRSSYLANAIRMKIFAGKYAKLSKQMRMSLHDFLNKDPITTDVLMYQISKFERNSQNLLQTYYVPNLTGKNNFSLFDSQVKFAKEYDYVLYTYNFAIRQTLNLGFYSPEQWVQALLFVVESMATSGENTHLIEVIKKMLNNEEVEDNDKKHVLEIVLKIMMDKIGDPFVYQPIMFRKLMFSDYMCVFDHPPAPPEVSIDGFMGVDNKIFFTLNNSISEFKAAPIIIQPEDEEIFLKNSISQDIEDPTQPMMFDGDDRIDYFQVFRIENHPASYDDFTGKFVNVSTTMKSDESGLSSDQCVVIKANHASYVDQITPNKKYYYIFRSIDIHGNISNPSSIYEVQIINDQGTIYPIIRTVDLLKINNKLPSTSAKRFIHISPNSIQSIVNEEESGFFDEQGQILQSADQVKQKVVLGLTEDKIWNKNYRLKIRSKTTGKVVEIDFKFIHKLVENNIICK